MSELFLLQLRKFNFTQFRHKNSKALKTKKGLHMKSNLKVNYKFKIINEKFVSYGKVLRLIEIWMTHFSLLYGTLILLQRCWVKLVILLLHITVIFNLKILKNN